MTLEDQLQKVRHSKAKTFSKYRNLKQVNNRLKERIIRRNEKINIIMEKNESLEFQLQLYLTKGEQNIQVIQRERDHKNRKV